MAFRFLRHFGSRSTVQKTHYRFKMNGWIIFVKTRKIDNTKLYRFRQLDDRTIYIHGSLVFSFRFMTSVNFLLVTLVVKMSYVWQQERMWQSCFSVITLSVTFLPSKLWCWFCGLCCCTFTFEGRTGGSLSPCSPKKFPCAPLFPKSILSIFMFLVPWNIRNSAFFSRAHSFIFLVPEYSMFSSSLKPVGSLSFHPPSEIPGVHSEV